MRFIRSIVVSALFLSALPALAEDPAKQPEKAKAETVTAGGETKRSWLFKGQGRLVWGAQASRVPVRPLQQGP
jgi:hypothetical protein